MSVGIRLLYFKVADLIDLVVSNGTAKMKLAILSFLYCRGFVKNSVGSIKVDSDERCLV